MSQRKAALSETIFTAEVAHSTMEWTNRFTKFLAQDKIVRKCVSTELRPSHTTGQWLQNIFFSHIKAKFAEQRADR